MKKRTEAISAGRVDRKLSHVAAVVGLFFWTLASLVGAQGWNVELVGHVNTGDRALDVSAANGKAYVAALGAGMEIIDLSDPTSPTHMGTYIPRTPNGGPMNAYAVRTLGTQAHILSGMYDIANVSDPWAPSTIGQSGLRDSPVDLYVTGNRTYIAIMSHRATSSISILDISNPTQILMQGRHFLTLAFPAGIFAEGNTAYCTGAVRLEILDATDPYFPALIGGFDLAGVGGGVVVASGLAYVAAGEGGLQIVDVSNPAAPSLRGEVDTPGQARDVALGGNLAYVADGTSGLQVIDVSNPASPSVVGSFDTPEEASSVSVENDLICVADGPGGLYVFRYGEFELSSRSRWRLYR